MCFSIFYLCLLILFTWVSSLVTDGFAMLCSGWSDSRKFFLVSPEMAAAERPYMWPRSMELQGHHTCQAAFNHSPDTVLLSHPDLTSPSTTFMTKWSLSQLTDYFLKMCLLDSDCYKEWVCHFNDTWFQIYSTSGWNEQEVSWTELFMFVCAV